MKVICAYFVVAIHCDIFAEFNPILNYIFTVIICRVAVPFFFIVSGYFYIKSLTNKKDITVKYLKRLLTTYSLWSLLYFIFKVSTSQYRNTTIGYIIKSNIKNFFIFGSSYHFWYFPALIFCILMVYLFYKTNCLRVLFKISILLYLIGLLEYPYHYLGNKIYFLNKLYNFSHFTFILRILLMGLPFFMLGYFIYSIEEFIYKTKNIIFIKAMILNLTFLTIEVVLLKIFKLGISEIISISFYPLIALMLILCLKNPLSNLNIYAKKLKTLANFTYYAHPLFISTTTLTLRNLFALKLSQTTMFLVASLLTLVIGIILNILNKNLINKFIY